MESLSQIFFVTLVIQNPKDYQKKELKFTVEVGREKEDYYGNGMHLGIKRPDGYTEGIDLRYDQSAHWNNMEVWIANYFYSNYTGEKGSWDIVDYRCKSKTAMKKALALKADY